MTDDSNISKDIKKIKYYLPEAYAFYQKFIYSEEHQNILKSRGFHIAGSVASVNWEVFASFLTGDRGREGYGSDLTNHEVKSSVNRQGFEYQYHLKGGKVKLEDDMSVNHIFISYSPDYKDVEVRLVKGIKLKAVFESWRPGLIENYEGETPKQRYRKRVPYKIVKENGTLILKIKDGSLTEHL